MVANVLNRDNVVSDFEIQLLYYVHFRTSNPVKVMNTLTHQQLSDKLNHYSPLQE